MHTEPDQSQRPDTILRINGSIIRISFGDLFSYTGLKAIPVSRHLFEMDVAPRSLMGQVIEKFRDSIIALQNHEENASVQLRAELKPHPADSAHNKELQEQLETALRRVTYLKAPAVLGATEDTIPTQDYLKKLRQILVNRFNVSDLRDICFELEVEFEDLGGESKKDKARELLDYLKRRERILDLVRTGERLRPDIHWGQVFQADEKVSFGDRLYPLGTTALIHLHKEKYLFFAITWTELLGHIPDDNATVTNMWLALEKFWHEARKYTHGEAINIPLIGSGITGIRLTPVHLLEMNLLAILNSLAKGGPITNDEIVIVLHPRFSNEIDLEVIRQVWKIT